MNFSRRSFLSAASAAATAGRVEILQDPEAVRRVLKGNNIEGFPAIEFYPGGEWRYGMDASLPDKLDKVKVTVLPMPANPFLVETAPVRLTAPLRVLPGWAANWTVVVEPPPDDLKLAAKNPADLPDADEMQSAGEVAEMTLVPYGTTHLRLTTLPVIHPAVST